MLCVVCCALCDVRCWLFVVGVCSLCAVCCSFVCCLLYIELCVSFVVVCSLCCVCCLLLDVRLVQCVGRLLLVVDCLFVSHVLLCVVWSLLGVACCLWCVVYCCGVLFVV